MLCSMWFRYNIDRMPQELNSYLRQLAYGKTGFSIRHLATVPRTYQRH